MGRTACQRNATDAAAPIVFSSGVNLKPLAYACGTGDAAEFQHPGTLTRNPDTDIGWTQAEDPHGAASFHNSKKSWNAFFGFRPVACEREAACQPQIGSRIELSPIGVDPGSAPTGALVIHNFLELSRCLRALMQAQVSQGAQISRLKVSSGGCPYDRRAEYLLARRMRSPAQPNQRIETEEGSGTNAKSIPGLPGPAAP